MYSPRGVRAWDYLPVLRKGRAARHRDGQRALQGIPAQAVSNPAQLSPPDNRHFCHTSGRSCCKERPARCRGISYALHASLWFIYLFLTLSPVNIILLPSLFLSFVYSLFSHFHLLMPEKHQRKVHFRHYFPLSLLAHPKCTQLGSLSFHFTCFLLRDWPQGLSLHTNHACQCGGSSLGCSKIPLPPALFPKLKLCSKAWREGGNLCSVNPQPDNTR